MLTQVETVSNGSANHLPSWSKVWLSAATRPSLAAYKNGESERTDLRRASLWILLSGLSAGIVNTLGALLTSSPASRYFDLGLLVAIPVFALLITCYWALFVACAHMGARLLKGRGTYTSLAYVFASFSAPLLIAVSLLSLIPRLNPFLLIVYLYWLGLYVVGLQAVQQVSRIKAFFIVLMTLVVLGSGMLGAVVLISYLGRYVL